ncbi:MBL fold metallo-hydrolase [Arthrobacter sp. AL08]|uniref:MBL fold metallo-hydrolase n=1 Tax=unclassified Arthrobacter TaxID=235627 RepID=UPI00249AE5A3|nr:MULTISPECIES: MBL fold metallo-hydrolase [unclassified Arthrobacter]MDI3242630.1 MBL fold metallo-hydrolase [Arthrobacter sp. AL05]MDI3278639.1 MBL fold metallo-hydrolase [Arthrobacter sp. AL08]
MLLTKFTHACVRLEKDGKVLVFDPGTFSETDRALAGADAVLITHEHADHIDVEAVTAALLASATLQLFAPAGVAAQLREKAPEAALRVHPVEPGDEFGTAGFAVRSFGGQHALIHPQIPVVANIGYLVDGNVYHPGDSFIVPDGVDVRTLLVPIHGPWSKVGEVIDFVIGVRARKAYPIHDALLNESGRGLVEGHVSRFGAKYDTEYLHLSTGDAVEV